MSYVGQSMPMMTNAQLAAGKGTFVDDVQLPGMTFMAVLRSPYAHARIRSIDAELRGGAPRRPLRGHRAEIALETNPIPVPPDPARRGQERGLVLPGSSAFASSGRRSPWWSRRIATRPTRLPELVDVDYQELAVVAHPEAALEPDPLSWSPTGART